jgi:hypothetical protein
LKSVACRRAILCFLFFVFGSVLGCGEEVDRLIAAINGKVITDGDLDLARSLNAILASGNSSGTGSRDQEINRLIDLELMRQELNNFSMAQEDETKVQARMASLRETYAGKGGIPALLQRLGLQESELISYLRLESSILAFVNFRFRPFANISGEEIKAYYDGRLAAQFRKSGIELPPLTQVAGKIEEILREEKINSMLDQWIKEIRRNSRIDYFEAAKANE